MADKGQFWLSPYAVLADPQKCRHRERARYGDIIDCDKVVACNGYRDVLQCRLCGRTIDVRCNFDEEYS